MNKSALTRLAILILATVTLTGCLLVPVDDGYSRGGSHDRGGGGGHNDRHDGPERR